MDCGVEPVSIWSVSSSSDPGALWIPVFTGMTAG